MGSRFLDFYYVSFFLFLVEFDAPLVLARRPGFHVIICVPGWAGRWRKLMQPEGRNCTKRTFWAFTGPCRGYVRLILGDKRFQHCILMHFGVVLGMR